MEGKAGTFMDAEDGELTNNPVEHGGVDSVIRFKHTADPQGSFDINYWVVAADSQSDAQVVHTYLKVLTLSKNDLSLSEHFGKCGYNLPVRNYKVYPTS